MISKVKNPPQETASVSLGPFIIVYFQERKYSCYQLVNRPPSLLGGLLSSLGSSLFGSGLSDGDLFAGQLGGSLSDSSVGVELQHGPDVLEGVGLDHGLLGVLVGLPEHLPDLLSLEQLGQIGDGHLGLGKVPAGLLLGSHTPCTVKGVQLLESSLSPDTETADVATRGQLQKVELADLDGVDTWDVSEGLGQTLVLVIDDKRSTLLDAPAVTHLSLSGPHPLGLVDLVDVVVGPVPLQEDHGLLGLGKGLDLVRHNQGALGGSLDTVTFGHDEGWDASGSDGGDHGVPLLGDGDLAVPPPVDLGGSEHVTSTAHVAESSLAGTVSATSTDTGDTGDGTSSSPGLGTGLVTGIPVDAVGLPVVLGDLVMDEGHDVGPDGGLENGRKADRAASYFTLVVVDGDQGTRC